MGVLIFIARTSTSRDGLGRLRALGEFPRLRHQLPHLGDRDHRQEANEQEDQQQKNSPSVP